MSFWMSYDRIDKLQWFRAIVSSIFRAVTLIRT